MTDKQDKKQDELLKQERIFKYLWLFMPLALCGVLYSLIQVGLEEIVKIETGYAAFISALIVAPISLKTYTYAVVRKAEERKASPSELRFIPRLFFGGIALAVLVVCIQLVAVVLCGELRISTGNSLFEGLANALGIAIFFGIFEELVSRGVILRISEKYIGSILAILISAIIFGMPHAFNPGATILTGVAITIQAGITLALIYIVTRNLWATIGVHMGWNFSVTLLGIGDVGAFQTTISGPSWLIGNKSGIEDSLVVIGTWLIIAFMFLVISIRKRLFVSYNTAHKQKHPI